MNTSVSAAGLKLPESCYQNGRFPASLGISQEQQRVPRSTAGWLLAQVAKSQGFTCSQFV